jgi:UDP-glucose:(heptosyl)LPS alpha-1,3-glucosyltransferase
VNEKRPGLRIAIVLDKFLPSRGGERYFSFLAHELTEMGHEVHVFATQIEQTGNEAYRLHLIPVWKFPRSMRILSFLRNSARAIEESSFDIVHGVAPTIAANVYNPHGGVEQAYLKQEFASMSSRYYYLYRLLRRYLSPRHYIEVWAQKRLYQKGRVERTIAISRMIKRDLMTYYGVPEKKIAVVFNAVDLHRFRPENRNLYRAKKRDELGIGRSEVLILFAGNNYRLKGLEPLVAALGIVKRSVPGTPFRLLVAGRGRRHRYQRLAERVGVSDMLIFLGAVTGMEQYYAASDLYVHPTFYDSCSLTVLEALASGLPVVTSRFNGAADAIASDKGGLVIQDPSDARELAAAITFFSDAKRRSLASTAARAWMEDYTQERNVEETLRVYHEVAGR